MKGRDRAIDETTLAMEIQNSPAENTFILGLIGSSMSERKELCEMSKPRVTCLPQVHFQFRISGKRKSIARIKGGIDYSRCDV